MKTASAALSLTATVLVLAGVASAAPQSPGGTPAVLPPAITNQLDARFPRWTIAPASADSMTAWRTGSRHIPNAERGDYDGDGRPDYVLAIAYPVAGGGSDRETRVDVVLFLGRGQAYRLMPISSDIGLPIEIRVHAKGERIQEYGEERSFVLKQAAFTLSPGDAGPCYTYVYRRGRFQSYWTCD